MLLYEKTVKEEAARDLRLLSIVGNGMAGGAGYKQLHKALKKQAEL